MKCISRLFVFNLFLVISYSSSAQCGGSFYDRVTLNPIISDTTKFYFDSLNNIYVVSKKAWEPLYQMDIPHYANVNGNVIAYFESPQNQIAIKAYYSEGVLSGDLILYYFSGKIKEFRNMKTYLGYSYFENGNIQDTSFHNSKGNVYITYYLEGKISSYADSTVSTSFNKDGHLWAKSYEEKSIYFQERNYKWFKNDSVKLSSLNYNFGDTIIFFAYRRNGSKKFESIEVKIGMNDCRFIYSDEMKINYFDRRGKMVNQKINSTQSFMKEFQKKSKYYFD